MKNLLIIIIIGFMTSAKAYIPSYSMMLSHLAHFQGYGGYRIEQKVFFKQGLEPILLKEIWWIHSSGKMRVDVKIIDKKTNDMYLRFLYHKNKKIFKNENDEIQKKSISYYHLERPFHLRDKNKLHKLFALWQVSPIIIPKREHDQGSDLFVRLVRKFGKIQYQISQKNNSAASYLHLKQDEFTIQSWQWKTKEKLIASDYKLYQGHLFFPSRRDFFYLEKKVSIQVQKVQNLKLDERLFYRSKLSKKNKISQQISSVDQDWIREFYKKFR